MNEAVQKFKFFFERIIVLLPGFVAHERHEREEIKVEKKQSDER